MMPSLRDRRTLALLPALPALLCVVAVVAPPSAHAVLSFTLSDQGLEPPSWDGGRSEITIADVNGDGHPDILSLGDHGNPLIGTQEQGLLVWLGDGAGHWSHAHWGTFGYGGIAVGDVNGDGLADAGYAMHHDYGSNDVGDALIEVALGDGTGTSWTPWDDGLATSGETYGMFGVVFADLDADGRLDIAVNSFGCCNGVHVYRNNGDGTWSFLWKTAEGNSSEDISAGDVNNDGFPDLAAALEPGCVWLNDGTGHFTRADGNLPDGGNSGLEGVALGDVNGDGADDLSFIDGGAPRVWTRLATGLWQNVSTGLPQTGSFEATRLADMDADGDVDLVALGNGRLRVWLNDGAGAWVLDSQLTLPSPGYYSAIGQPVDVDHSGRLDVALVTESGGKNHPHVAREASGTAAAPSIAPLIPQGGEVCLVGSVRAIEWVAAVPAADAGSLVDLELSMSGVDGPWFPVATGVPNNGHHQWTVPAFAPSESCYVRYTLHGVASGDVVALSRRAFAIHGGPDAVADPARDDAGALHVTPSASRGVMRIAAPAGVRSLVVCDARGAVVRTLAPSSAITWDGRDAHGARVPAGVYVIRASTPAGTLAARALRLD